MSTLLPAQVAWYVTGRFYVSADGSMADYGYFLHLAGVSGSMFDGKPGETTAHFTFAAQPFSATTVPNGALKLGLDPVGSFAVFFQEQPAGNFDDPQTFAQGKRIATFRRTTMVVGTTVDVSASHGAASVLADNVFSAELIDSSRFRFNGREYDLAAILGFGVTQFGTAAGAFITPAPKGYSAAVPFTGSAIALPGR